MEVYRAGGSVLYTLLWPFFPDKVKKKVLLGPFFQGKGIVEECSKQLQQSLTPHSGKCFPKHPKAAGGLHSTLCQSIIWSRNANSNQCSE